MGSVRRALLLIALAAGCRARPLEWAPEFRIPKLLHAPRERVESLKDFPGEVVVLEFWATWCGPCRETIPHMNKLVDQYAGKPVRFIAVTAESPETVLEFTREHPIHAWIGIDPRDAVSRAFRVRGIPHVVVIDRFGRVVHRVSTQWFYASDIDDALNAKPPKQPHPG